MSVRSLSRLSTERSSRLSNNERFLSTISTNRPRSNLSSSTSVERIKLNSVCSNHTFPSRLSLKKLKPEPWQKFFDGEKRQIYSHQGLTVKKNKQSIDAIINEDFFNITDEDPNADENSQRPGLPPALQAHIDSLYEQINDLSLQLAEERLNNKQARAKAEENFNNQLQNQNKQFQELLHHKMVDHEKDLQEQNEKHLKLLHEERNESNKREEHLKSELEFVKASFHTYKMNLEKEYEEKLQIKLNEKLKQMNKDLKDKEEEINKKLNEAVLKERKNLNARQKMEMENLRKQHQKEIDTIHKTFADSAFDRARVESLSKELTSTKIELDDAKERAINLAQRLKDLEVRHSETTRELNDYRIRFDDKAKEIEKLFAGRLHQLQLQNADLRSMYMKKCAELVDERALTQEKLNEKVKLTRKQLQRKLLDIRIASVVQLNTEDEPRRLSTCATASQFELSPTRCCSALAASHPVSTMYDETSKNTNSVTDFTMDNVRRETRLRRRTSLPITEREHDIVRYLTSSSSVLMHDSLSSKYNFQNENTMIKNLSLEDLQQTFKS